MFKWVENLLGRNNVLKNINPDCFLSLSVHPDGSIGFDFCFDQSNIDKFISIFAGTNSGAFLEPMLEKIDSVLNRKEVIEYFNAKLEQEFDALMVNDDDDESPLVSPLDVFREEKKDE